MSKNNLFPDRLQGSGFRSERAAIRAARVELGGKAKVGLTFVITVEGGQWGWIGASMDEVTKTLLAQQAAARTAAGQPPLPHL